MGSLPLMGAGPSGAGGAAGFGPTAISLGASLVWLMDDPSGTTCTDSSANARNGTYGTGVTLNQASILPSGSGKCGLYDNTANAKITSTYNPYTGNITVAGWAKLTNFTGQVELFGSSSATNAPTLVLANITGQPIWFSDVAAASVSWTGGDFPAATNNFYALTWNNTTKVSELFVGDGTTLTSKGQKTSVNAFNATPGNFQVGSYGANTGFRGQIDAHAVFPSVVSSANLTSLMQAS